MARDLVARHRLSHDVALPEVEFKTLREVVLAVCRGSEFEITDRLVRVRDATPASAGTPT